MADCLLNYVVADLCIGKPTLRPLSAVAVTVRQALTTLKTCEESYLSVCSCKNHHHHHRDDEGCICIGKVCMVDIICFLSRMENSYCTTEALTSPLSVLLPPFSGIIKHVEPSSSLLDAIELILKGAQNLVVPIKTKFTTKVAQKSSTEVCWLTQEDVIRFLLSSIGRFYSIATSSIESLGLISSDFIAVWYDSPAAEAIEAISHSLAAQTSVGVVDSDGILVGEISPFTLAYCDETVAAAINTLSCGDLMAYIDCGGPPEDISRVVKARLKERNLEGMLEEFEIFSSISSSNSSFSSLNSCSDEELSSSPSSPTTAKAGKYSRSRSYSARMIRRAEAIVCYPGSSLVAVMTQSIAHRVNYVWVVDNDCHLIGIVTFSKILKVFRDLFLSM